MNSFGIVLLMLTSIYQKDEMIYFSWDSSHKEKYIINQQNTTTFVVIFEKEETVKNTWNIIFKKTFLS